MKPLQNTKLIALLSAFLLGAVMFASPALAAPPIVTDTQGGVTCKSHNAVNGDTMTYPMDYDPANSRPNVHYWVCDPSSTVAHDDVVGAAVRSFSMPATSRDVFYFENVAVYYFANRADYAAFIHAKYNDDVTFAPGSANCGKTSWQQSSGVITSAVWGTCAYTGATALTDNDLKKVISHEMGHGYDFALGKRDGGGAKSHKSGFVNVAGGTDPVANPVNDLFQMTPQNWAGLSDANQQTYVCTIFGTLSPSNLEKALATPANAVCSNAVTINNTYRVGGVATGAVRTPTDLMRTRVPYFSNPNAAFRYEDLWAEIFSSIVQPGSPSPLLTMTDKALLTNSVMGNPHRVYDCSRKVVEIYTQNRRAPTVAELTAQNCATGGSF